MIQSVNRDYVVVRRRSPRFQLVKSAIESLAPEGTYHFIADCDGQPTIEYKITRRELEDFFARAMSTMSYRDRGLFHQRPWPRAEQFRI